MTRGSGLSWLALVVLLRGTDHLPARLSYAVASAARRWRVCLLYVVSLVPHRTYEPLPKPRRAPRSALVPPRPPHALVVLLHRAQPCAP